MSTETAQEPTERTVNLADDLFDTIAKVRDAGPRLPNDADTDEIVAALWPVLGGFLRGVAKGYALAAQDEDEDVTPTGRALLAVKAQAMTDLADEIDDENKTDYAAIYA